MGTLSGFPEAAGEIDSAMNAWAPPVVYCAGETVTLEQVDDGEKGARAAPDRQPDAAARQDYAQAGARSKLDTIRH